MKSNLALLKNYQLEWEAQLLTSRLADEGIESLVETVSPSQAIWYLNWARGFDVFVIQDDYARALVILSGLEDSPVNEDTVGSEL